ncbi:MAG: PilN domain-containing protein [Desulfovibrionales bacterium]
MIRINLLPKQKRVAVSNVEKELVLYFLLITLMVVGILSYDMIFKQQLEVVRQEHSQKKTYSAQLKKKVSKVNKIKKELADLDKKIQIIKDIRIKQGLPIQYIDEVVKKLPPEKIWFETMQIDSSGKIVIRGIALDNQAFALYVRQLRESPYIDSVVTQRTSRKEIQGLGLVEFNCNIVAQPAEEQSNG